MKHLQIPNYYFMQALDEIRKIVFNSIFKKTLKIEIEMHGMSLWGNFDYPPESLCSKIISDFNREKSNIIFLTDHSGLTPK